MANVVPPRNNRAFTRIKPGRSTIVAADVSRNPCGSSEMRETAITMHAG
jgi:hypothetical protein